MTILSNYIFRQVWVSALAMSFGLSLLILLTQSLRFLDLMISAGAAPMVFFQLMALSLPRLVEIVTPIALAISVLIIALKLQGDQELTVMQATGTTPWQLTRPILNACFLGSVLMMSLAFWITPATIATLQSQRQMIQAQFSLSLLQPGVFNFLGDDIMVYFDSRDTEGRLVNLILHDQRDTLHPYTLLAETGEMIGDGESYRLDITNGRRQQLNANGAVVDQLTFTKYGIALPKTIREISQRWKEPDERTLMELLQPVVTQDDVDNKLSLTVEMHRRFVAPFLPFSLALPVLWFILRTARPRQRGLNVIGISVVMITALQALWLIALSLAAEYEVAIGLIYGAGIAPAFFALYSLSKSYKKTPKLIRSST